jgi:hypothetical protein
MPVPPRGRPGVKYLWTCGGWSFLPGRKPFEDGFARQFLPGWAISAVSERQVLPGSAPKPSPSGERHAAYVRSQEKPVSHWQDYVLRKFGRSGAKRIPTILVRPIRYDRSELLEPIVARYHSDSAAGSNGQLGNTG